MTAFPAVNRSDVTAAPIRTSRHGTGVLGMNLKMSANRIVIMQNEKTKFTDPKTMAEIGSNPPTNLSVADNKAVTTKEVSNKNPVATTRPSEKTRCLIVAIQKPFAPPSTFQIVLKAS